LRIIRLLLLLGSLCKDLFLSCICTEAMLSTSACEPQCWLGKNYFIILKTYINIECTSKLIGILKYAAKRQVTFRCRVMIPIF